MKQTIGNAWKYATLYVVETKSRATQAMVHAKMKAALLDRVLKYTEF